jgi:(2R)-sulfolactate sulfo-lyase subunit alpha
MKKGILLHEKTDDVGVAVMDLTAGEEINVVTLEGDEVKVIKMVTDVPLGHKVAMTDLAVDKHVIEYGRAIGSVSAAIKAGEHVHIHNIKSLRWAASTTNVL